MKSNLFNMVAALLVVSVCSAVSIGYVQQKTAEPIAASKKTKIINAIKEMVGDFNNNPFEEKTALSGNEVELYPARQDGNITSVAVKSFSNQGFGGKIELILGILMDGTVTGYKVTQQNETPGLGSKITEEKFSHQFVSLNTHSDQFKLSKDGGEIDAITGATISSKAVIDAVQKAISAYNNFAGAITHDDEE